jgi:hypothetical protein
MIFNYEGFLKECDELKNNSNLPKDRKKVIIKLLNALTETLKTSIDYRKLKDEISVNGSVVDTEFLDEVMDNDLLNTFFGVDDINEIEKKLKELRKALKGINK